MVNIILSIPGPWGSLEALANSIREHSSAFALEDTDLVRIADGCRCQLQLVEHDPNLRAAFEAANRQSLSRQELDLLESHSVCTYLIGAGGSLAAARFMMQAAAALLLAGGYAVKVETAGVAHSPRSWID